MQAIAEKSLLLLNNPALQTALLAQGLEKYVDAHRDVLAYLDVLLKNPEALSKRLTAYWQDALGLLEENMQLWLQAKIKPIDDKRFRSAEWTEQPFFNLLCQHYLLASKHLNAILDELDLGDIRNARRVRFFVRQYLDALSPDNFFQTNPQLIAETLQSHGENLLLGLKNFLADIDSGSGRLIMKMTDTEAFTVGANIATTPGDVIFRNDLMELIQYKAQTQKVQQIPLLIIPPWINKYYILDLQPENSLIAWLVQQGITVFVISWVNPDARHADKGLDNYLMEGPIAALDVIQQQLQVKEVNALGFCIGGTLLSMLLAYHKAKQQTLIHSATFLAALIDFSDPGDIVVFIDEEQIRRIEERMQTTGYLEGHFMASSFNALRASDLIWSFFIKHYLRGLPHLPFDLLYWNADTTNMPAKMHSQYLRRMYLHNDLIKPGKIRLNRTPIDISKIDVPSFFVATQKDHIAPWQSVYAGFQQLQGEKRFLLGGSGHIAGIAIPPGSEKYGFYRNLHITLDAEEWLKQAQFEKGSWWPEWFTWLQKKSGPMKPARSLKSQTYPSLTPAPGVYVHKKSR
jgi:polyhydroxyalkanoate synthase